MDSTPPRPTDRPQLRQPLDPDEASDLGQLFHRLNNQLGIILAHAELLAAKSADQASRSRAAQVVTSALDAMSTARDIRAKMVGAKNGSRP
jgi:hypothetical protein